MELTIPESLELEHEELHEQLYKGIKEGGKVGEAAKAVADILHPHFEKEEEYALPLPPLGLLSLLLEEQEQRKGGKSKITQEMKEHNEIVATLNNLIEIAKIENKTDLIGNFINLILPIHAGL